MSRAADEELSLAFFWGVFVVAAIIVMIGASAVGARVSIALGHAALAVSTGLVVVGVTGVLLHGGRYMIAGLTERIDEWWFRRTHGMEDWYAAAKGEPVTQKRHPLLSVLVMSSDWDLAIQVVIGVLAALAGLR
jgi:hypothetical protein